jgi:hypothetical protein
MGITGTRRAANRSNAKTKSVSLFIEYLAVSCLHDTPEYLQTLADLNLLTLALKMVLCQTMLVRVLLRAKENPRASVLVSQLTAPALSQPLSYLFPM